MNFNQRVWRLLEQIPRGKVTTYKIIARKLGTKAYRVVGTACARNPNAPKVPCHRVVNSNGSVGNYSGVGKKGTKMKLLQEEGIEVSNGRIDLKKYLYDFN